MANQLLFLDKFLSYLHQGLSIDKSEGVKTSWQRSTLLVLAITLHNIPEGLAVGLTSDTLDIQRFLQMLSGNLPAPFINYTPAKMLLKNFTNGHMIPPRIDMPVTCPITINPMRITGP